MTKRTVIQVPSDFALCEDGTVWKWVPAYYDKLGSISIPSHWNKLPNIPSDEEYEKQKEERETLWAKIDAETEKRLNETRSFMNRGVMK